MPYRTPEAPSTLSLTLDEQIQVALKQREEAEKALKLKAEELKLQKEEERLTNTKATIEKMKIFASFVKENIPQTLLSDDFLKKGRALIKLPGSDKEGYFCLDQAYDETRLVSSILDDELCQHLLTVSCEHRDLKPSWYSFNKNKNRVKFYLNTAYSQEIKECSVCKRKTSFIIYHGVSNKRFCNRCYWLCL